VLLTVEIFAWHEIFKYPQKSKKLIATEHTEHTEKKTMRNLCVLCGKFSLSWLRLTTSLGYPWFFFLKVVNSYEKIGSDLPRY